MKSRSIIFALLLASGCGRGDQAASLPPVARASEQPVEVKTLKVERRDVSIPIVATGTSKPIREADLATAVGARIESIAVAVGAQVRAEQVLVRLDARTVELSAAQARASAAAARAQAEQARVDKDRLTPLAERGTIAASRAQVLETQRAAADSAARAAEAQAAAAARAARNATLRAPFAGTVIAIPVEVGEMASVAPATVLVRLADLSQIEVSVRVHEREIPRLTVGDPVVARYPNLGISVEGKLFRVGLEVDPRTRTVEVLAHIPNGDGKLRSGLFTELEIKPTATRSAMLIPTSAVGEAAEQHFCYVVEQGVVKRRVVTVQLADEKHVEVIDGLADGETIVAEHLDRVSEGARIEAKVLGASR